MEATAKCNDSTALGMGASNFDGVFHSLCASGEESRLYWACNWNNRVDTLSQLHVFSVWHNLVAAVGKALQLGRNSSLDTWMHMASIQYGNAASEVNETTPFNIPKLRVLGMVDEKITHHGHTAGSGGQAPCVPLSVGSGGSGGFHYCIHGFS